MTSLQKFITSLLPKAWAADLERESKHWMLCCPCGHSVSIWDARGIRWKAKGNPKRLMKCPSCHQRTWHVVRFMKDEL